MQQHHQDHKDSSSSPILSSPQDPPSPTSSNGLFIKGYHILFPYPNPYPSQKSFMFKLLNALTSSSNALLESPTGSGKTLALLCSTLAWLRHERATLKNHRKVYFLSRTHSQIDQVVQELRSTGYKPVMSVLGSREQLCIHPDVVKEPGKKIEKCKELVKESKCEYYRKAEESAKQSKFTDEFVWDIEDIVKEGKRNEFCPYFAARVLADEAEFIIAPYNYVLDPVIRNSMKINLNGAVVVIDEAHNLENACRDIASRNFREDEIVLVINELHSLLDSRTIKDFVKDAFKRMHEKLRSLGNIIEANRHKLSISEFEKEQNVFKGQDILNLFDTLDCTPETYSNIMRDVKIIAEHVMESARNASPYMETQTQESQESQNGEQAKSRKSDSLSQHSLSLLEGFSMVIDFIFSNNCQHLNDFRLVIQREAKNVDSESKWDTYIGFWCMNPAVSFKNMAKGAHSIILTSGTLSPMNSFASELGVEFPHRLETAHIIPRSNIFVRAISHGPNGVKLECTYKNTEVYKFQDDLGETLLSVFPNCPDGVLVFFPSYGLMEKLQNRWKRTGLWKRMTECKRLFCESKFNDRFLKDMNSYIKHLSNEDRTKGAVFFAVCRGKISEGIDFSDHYARCVISIGIPFPHARDLQVNLKRNYNDAGKKVNPMFIQGREWYDLQAYRALNQAVGRCIRHKNDFGAIILLDSRFAETGISNNLSKWIRESVPSQRYPLNVITTQLCEFFENMKQNSDCVSKIPKFLRNNVIEVGYEEEETITQSNDEVESPSATSGLDEQETMIAPSPFKNLEKSNDKFTEKAKIASQSSLDLKKDSSNSNSRLQKRKIEKDIQRADTEVKKPQVQTLHGYFSAKSDLQSSSHSAAISAIANQQQSLDVSNSFESKPLYNVDSSMYLFCNCGFRIGVVESNSINEIYLTDNIQLFRMYEKQAESQNENGTIQAWEINCDSESKKVNISGLSPLSSVLEGFHESFWCESTKSTYVPRMCSQCNQFKGFMLFEAGNQKFQLYNIKQSSDMKAPPAYPISKPAVTQTKSTFSSRRRGFDLT